MDLIDLYNEYRKEEIRLVNREVFNTIGREVFAEAAGILDLADEHGNLKFTDENQMGALMDFAIHELRYEGRNAVEDYIKTHGAHNNMEERVLEALKSSYTSLFRVVNISESKHMLFLKDLYNQGKNIRLTDITLSHTGDSNILLFTRILPFPELNMTSGASFVFPGDMEGRLMNMYRSMSQGITEDISANRFIIFYSLYKEYGLDIFYNDITHEHDCDCGCGHNHEH